MNALRTALAAAVVLAAAPAPGLSIEGHDYPATTKLGGKTLHIVGVGLREATIFKVDVYTFAAYAEHKTCDLAKLVASNEAKLLRLDFVRDVSASKMRGNMKKNFARHTPRSASADLKKRIADFVGLFGIEAEEGTRVEVRYEPGKGTSVFVNGVQRGSTVQGHDFIRILWDIYFGKPSCCPNLLDDVRRTCRGG